MRTLRKQWSYNEVLSMTQITEENPAFTCLLRYANSEAELPHFFERLAPIYQSATAESSQVFLQVLGGALEVLKRSSMKGVAVKAARKLVKEHMKLFYRLLSANHNAIVGPTLDLLTTIASIDGSLNELVFGSFDFSLKSLAKFPFMRKKVLAQEERHDIRTAFVQFVLCFLKYGNFATKSALAKMQNLVGPVFAGLPEDKSELIEEVFTRIKVDILYNEKKSKSLPIAFLYASSLAKIAKLYESENEAMVQSTDALLRMICTSNEVGLAFKISTDDLLPASTSVKNKILLDFLLSLNPLESLMKQSLCIDILKTCPDLLSSYWSKSSFSFEPEASARFINLTSFVCKVLQTVPTPLSRSSECSLLPKGISAAALQRGLNHQNALVVYFTTMLISTCLAKVEQYLRDLEWHISVSADNSLVKVRNEFVENVLSRVPTGKIIYAAYAQLIKKPDTSATSQIAEHLLIAMRIHSRLSVNRPSLGRCLLKIHPDTSPVPVLSESALSAYWAYIADTCPFNLGQPEIDYLVAKIDTQHIQPLILTCLAQSGFVGHIELEFIHHQLEKTRHDLQLVLKKVLSTLAQLNEQRFITTENSPIISALELSKEFTDFLKARTSLNASIDSSLVQRTVMKLSKDEEAAINEDDEKDADIPEFVGSSLPVVVEEILALVRNDMVTRAIAKCSFDQFTPLSADSTNELVSKKLLVQFDPSSWLQLMAQILTTSDLMRIDLRLLVETGVLAFAIHGLSSQCQEMFQASHFVLAKFYVHLLQARFRERREILLAVECLRNSIQPEKRLDPVICAFFCETLQVLLRPAHFMYASLMELVLGNHSIDLSRIPLLMECLCSDSEQATREHAWILRILLSGLRPGSDFHQIYQYNHVIPSIETLLQLPHLDAEVERLCRQVLGKALEHPGFRMELVDQQGVQVWLETLPAQRTYMLESLSALLD